MDVIEFQSIQIGCIFDCTLPGPEPAARTQKNKSRVVITRQELRLAIF
jgi:hypothetical protein